MKESKFKNNIDILLISDNGLETVGGEQESTKIIIDGVKNYYSIGVIQPGSIKKTSTGVHYYPLTKKNRIKHLIKSPYYFLKYIWRVRDIIKKEKPKIIHTQAQVSFFIVTLLNKFSLIPKSIKLIHTERGLYIRYNSFFKRLFLFLINELDVLVATTNFNLNHWKNVIQNKGIILEYNIIENTAGEIFETYQPNLKTNNIDNIVIGFAGRYSEQKNWPLAIEICEKLNKDLKKNLFVKMAVGCLDEASKIQTQKMFSDLTKLLGNRFEGAINIDLKAMDKFYYDIDVFVLTSLENSESFGRTLVEAMSRKTAVLTTNAGGPVEVIRDQSNICNTAEEFISVIIEFYYNKEKLNIEKNLNYKRVNEKYSLKNNIEKHLKLYKRLLKEE